MTRALLTALLVASGADLPPLGIGLEQLSYPHPVHFLALVNGGQAVRMAYMDVAPAGAPSGKTVVLLHGKNFDSGTWDEVITALTAAGHRVLVPDQIGFNKSTKPDIAYSFDVLAENTARLLDALGVQRAVVVAHSTGGMLGVRFARKYPARVTRLVLEDPIGLEDYRDFIPRQTLDRLTEDELSQTPAEVRAFVGRYFVTWQPRFQRTVDWRIRVMGSGEYPRWARASARVYEMIYEQPMRSELKSLVPAVLLITGAQDRTAVLKKYAPPEVAARLGNIPTLARAASQEIPRCTWVEVPGVGHVPHLEAPAAYLEALLPFVAGS